MVWKSRDLARRHKELLQTVWIPADTDEKHWAKRSDPYVNHFSQLIPNNRETASLDASDAAGEIVKLVDLIKKSVKADAPVRDIANHILSAKLSWLGDNSDIEAAKSALSLAVELWLFTEPVLDNLDQPFDQAIKDRLQQSVAPRPGSPAISTMLSSDISAKSLVRKAGLRLMWTSNLSEHLLLIGDKYLSVFCHARILARYQSGIEKAMYPDGFLEEVSRTLDLLFPTTRTKDAKRVLKISRKQKVDIEAIRIDKQMMDTAKHQCSNYHYFGERLAIIQAKYDAARPHNPKEWWYDRRNLREWAALWIAVVAFVLALVFGVISSVTGILQVYASFHFR